MLGNEVATLDKIGENRIDVPLDGCAKGIYILHTQFRNGTSAYNKIVVGK